MEYAIIRKNVKDGEFTHIYQDLPVIHTIRGRLLNLSTILEHFMKDYLSKKGINIPSKIVDYNENNGVFNKFLLEIKNDPNISQKGIGKFEKHFKYLTQERNNFAHGIIYYKNKKSSRPQNINNNIFNKYSQQNSDQSLNKNKTVFDKLNKSYEYVFDWLEKKKVLKLEGFEILKAKSQTKFSKIK